MSSTYSPNLRVELIGTGDQAGTWGSTTNTNLGTLLENAVSGYVSVSITSANQALTALNGADDQARNAVLALTTTTGANFAVYAPPSPKTYVVTNSSAYTASVYNSTILGNTTAAGTGVAVPAGKTITIWSDGTNMAVQISHLPTLSLTSDLAVADGGTGASTAADARTNLGVTATGADTTYAFRANNLSDVASTSTSRTNLGLGTIATQNSNAVSITGGSITGITDIAVADGGTGSSTSSGARTNLGVAIGSDVQAYDADLTALGGLAKTDGNFIVGNGSTWVAESGATARTSLGLGSLATANTINNDNWSGTDLAVANGGTGASDAATARTNLGLVIGTDVAPVASPALTGAPTAPTATAGTNTTQVATTAFVKTAVDNYDAALTVSTGQIENDAVTTAKIAPTGVSAGSYGSSSAIPVVTVNAEGQVTSATTAAITIADPIGVGQTWQNVASSRAVNTNYTNTTGRPIQVMAGIYSNYGVYSSAVVDGVTMGQGYLYSCCGVGINFDMPYSFIVPAGSIYRINGTSVQNWAELR